MFNPAAKLHKIGRFDGVRLIGIGGVGVVFEVWDPLLRRRVALKLCKDHGRAARAALAREAMLLAQVQHPNVVTIHEVGLHRGEFYYVMELVAGRSGHDYVRECGDWRDAVDVYVAAGRGLAAAHARGIVHGDFKPANLLVGADGRVRVADFGLARALAEHTRARIGTLAFMAPERLLGQAGDERSDQFSFCVALWQLLYGVRPFRGEARDELLASMSEGDRRTGAALPGVPRRLRAVVEQGLAIAPADRHPSMTALVERMLAVRERPILRRVAPLCFIGLLGVGIGGLFDAAERRSPCELPERGCEPERGSGLLVGDERARVPGRSNCKTENSDSVFVGRDRPKSMVRAYWIDMR